MKIMKTVLVLFLCVVLNSVANAQNIGKLKKYLEKGELESLSEQKFAQKALTAEDAYNVEQILIGAWEKETKEKYHHFWEYKKIVSGDLQMRFAYRVFGDKPEDGRSLYISMHGGGTAPEEINSQQWKNQIRLYEPQEGVYIAPRAPWDDWDMWFKPGLDKLFERLIRVAVVEMDVNPDKVYLLGYSAGGDGVWRMAPRLADRWAAASMMAGHPGDASQVNLRNVPYMIWMGEFDAAYERNVLAEVKGKALDSLQQMDPEGYIHETHIVKGKGHWMDRVDSLAIPWMAKYKRNALPRKIVWRQEGVVRPSMYWLEVKAVDARQGMTVVAEIKGNEVEITKCDYSKLRICLNDEIVNMDEPVKITYQGVVLFEGYVKRTTAYMAKTLHERGDKKMFFSGYVDVKLDIQANNN